MSTPFDLTTNNNTSKGEAYPADADATKVAGRISESFGTIFWNPRKGKRKGNTCHRVPRSSPLLSLVYLINNAIKCRLLILFTVTLRTEPVGGGACCWLATAGRPPTGNLQREGAYCCGLPHGSVAEGAVRCCSRPPFSWVG